MQLPTGYVDAKMQTEPDETDPLYVPRKIPPRQGFMPLTKRLLKRCFEDRLRLEKSRQSIEASPEPRDSVAPMPTVGPDDEKIVPADDIDTEMKDADTSMTLPKAPQPRKPSFTAEDNALQPKGSPEDSFKKPSHPWPSSVAHHLPIPSSHARGGREALRVQLPPSEVSNVTQVASQTPTSSTSSLVQSPLTLKSGTSQPATQTPGSNVTAPSPVKKKLSLGDYMSRRGTLATPTSEKPPPMPPLGQPAPKNLVSASEESSSQMSVSGDHPGNETKRESSPSTDVPMQDIADSPTTLARTIGEEPNTQTSRDPRLSSRQ